MTVIAGAPEHRARRLVIPATSAAAELVRAGAVDAFASDYVPASLVEAAFLCVDGDRHHAAPRRRA